MSEFSSDPKQATTPQKSIEDPIASLDGAKNQGDKMSLLEAILQEGKYMHAPLVGPQSIATEASFSSSEMIKHAISHTRSAEMDVAKSLSPEMKISLVERIIADRPDITVAQTKAICKELDINPKPFVDALVKDTVSQLQDAIENQKDIHQVRQLTVSLLYAEKATTDAIADTYASKTGIKLQQAVSQQFKDPATSFALDIALLGQQPTPLLDLERIMAILDYEKHQQKQFGGLFYTADHIHLAHADQAVRKAASFFEKLKEAEPLGDTFYAHLREATDAWQQYIDSKGTFAHNPALLRGILIAVLLGLCVLFINQKDSALYYWGGTIAFSMLIYGVSLKRQLRAREQIAQKLKDRFTTTTERRAHEKSYLRKSLVG